MQIRMLGVMCLGLLAACGPAGEDVSSVESAVFSANDSSHARELIVHCSNDVWTVLVRATKEVRAVEVVTNLNGSYATLDGPLKAPYQDDINGWAFVQPVHVSADEAELARLSREGVAVTSTACDAGTRSSEPNSLREPRLQHDRIGVSSTYM